MNNGQEQLLKHKIYIGQYFKVFDININYNSWTLQLECIIKSNKIAIIDVYDIVYNISGSPSELQKS